MNVEAEIKQLKEQMRLLTQRIEGLTEYRTSDRLEREVVTEEEPPSEETGPDNVDNLVFQAHKLLEGQSKVVMFNVKGFCWTPSEAVQMSANIVWWDGGHFLFYIPTEERDLDCPETRITQFFSPFSNEQRIALMKVLAEGDCRTSSELKEKTGLQGGQLYHHLRELAAAGYLSKKERDTYALTPKAKRMLIMVTHLARQMMPKEMEMRPEDFDKVEEAIS